MINLYRPDYRILLFFGALILFSSRLACADNLEEANKLFKQGQNKQALENVDSYLAQKPKDPQARFLKGLIYTEQNKTAAAISIFSSLSEDFPELPEPYNNLAVLYAGQGQYDKAKQALEMAIRTHPSYATAHENLGDIYAKLASQAYDRALQLDRNSASTQTKLAMIKDLFRDGSPDKRLPDTPSGAIDLAKTDVVTPTNGANKISDAQHTTSSTSKPTASIPEETASDSQLAQVIQAVNAWASAWSSRNVQKYLTFYATDFNTPSGLSRTDWEAVRKERILSPKSIKVSISKVAVKFIDNNHAVVNFRQSYRASHLKATGNKTLRMVKSDTGWLIQEELSR